MATLTATETKDWTESRWPVLLAYLAAVIVAETLIGFKTSTGEYPYQPIGLSIHIVLVFTLLFASVIVESRDTTMAPLLVATSLASLVRVFSLAVPHYDFLKIGGVTPELDPQNTLPWLALVSVPLLASVAAVAYVQKLRPRDLGLGFPGRRGLPLQVAVGLTGVPLGAIEFLILRFDLKDLQSGSTWISAIALEPIVLGAIVIFFATGLSEELIFRAILLRRAVEGLGARRGLLYVTVLFASLHIFYGDPVDLAFVFVVGLFYGVVVLRTKNLWGAIFSHSLGNVILYLVAPFIR